MRKQVFKFGVVSCFLALLIATPALAQLPGTTLRVTIPFDFDVRGKTLPAGKYYIRRISDTPDGLVIESKERRAHTMFETEPVQARAIIGKGKLVFHRYGDSYFLYEIWSPGEQIGRELLPSREERNMRNQTASNKTEPEETVAVVID